MILARVRPHLMWNMELMTMDYFRHVHPHDLGYIYIYTTNTTFFTNSTWNHHAKSSCSKPRCNLIMISRNSCFNDNFFFGLFLLIGGRSFGPYNGDDNIFVLSWYDFGLSRALVWDSRLSHYVITWALPATWLKTVLNRAVVLKSV